MTEPRIPWYYRHQLNRGELTISIVDKLSLSDCEDIEAHFALIMKQCRRRAKVEHDSHHEQ